MKKMLSILALSVFATPVAHAQEAVEEVIIPETTEACTRSPILASGQNFCGQPVVISRSRASSGGRGRGRRDR